MALSRKQLKVLPVLLSTPTLAAAARVSKVSRRQLDRWLQQSDFKKELDAAARELFAGALLRLRAGAPAAASTISQLRSTASTDGVRLRAACATFDLIARADLSDVLARLEKLEALQEKHPAGV